MGFLSKLFSGNKRSAEQKDRPFVTAVVVAAGSSQRMGTDKIFMELAGMPVIYHTLSAFESCSAVDEIIAVTTENGIAQLNRLCGVFGFSKIKKIVKGGDTRMRSVLNGILEASERSKLVAIHDGARPLVTPELIESVIAEAAECGAAAPGVGVKDTVKTVKDGLVESTPDRSTLVAVQTPQVFDTALIKGALTQAIADGIQLTDDCSAVEVIGGRVRICPGDYSNIKLTTREDVAVAEALLDARRAGIPGDM